jgi:SHAQKYF class myb-like DNA-binding protein
MYGKDDSFYTNNAKSVTSDDTGGISLRNKRRVSYYKIAESKQNNLLQGLNNGRWSIEEHRKFIMGLFEYGNNWKEVIKLVGTRSTAQARSHCQKFFSKLHKVHIEGITEEMCNIKYLHNLYKTKLSEREAERLYHLLTDVAYFAIIGEEGLDDSTVNPDKTHSTIRIDLKDSDYNMSKFYIYSSF